MLVLFNAPGFISIFSVYPFEIHVKNPANFIKEKQSPFETLKGSTLEARLTLICLVSSNLAAKSSKNSSEILMLYLVFLDGRNSIPISIPFFELRQLCLIRKPKSVWGLIFLKKRVVVSLELILLRLLSLKTALETRSRNSK